MDDMFVCRARTLMFIYGERPREVSEWKICIYPRLLWERRLNKECMKSVKRLTSSVSYNTKYFVPEYNSDYQHLYI